MAGAAVEILNLTVLVDGGMLESFANDRVVITSLLSPSSNGSTSDADARQVCTTGRQLSARNRESVRLIL
eukprot:COSAG05_NODE_74_length_21769_cov_194.316290_22_plen_70_part_00